MLNNDICCVIFQFCIPSFAVNCVVDCDLADGSRVLDLRLSGGAGPDDDAPGVSSTDEFLIGLILFSIVANYCCRCALSCACGSPSDATEYK